MSLYYILVWRLDKANGWYTSINCWCNTNHAVYEYWSFGWCIYNKRTKTIAIYIAATLSYLNLYICLGQLVMLVDGSFGNVTQFIAIVHCYYDIVMWFSAASLWTVEKVIANKGEFNHFLVWYPEISSNERAVIILLENHIVYAVCRHTHTIGQIGLRC